MFLKTIASLSVALLLSTQAQAQALTPIKVSYQPALYWALPFYIATQKGWWKEVGLAPEFSTFPAGVPQIAASAAKSWDVGGTGSIPAVLGHVRFGIKTIGVTTEQSNANALVLSSRKAAEFARDPAATLRGQTIAITQNSTVDFAVQSCLKKYGLKKSDVVFKNMGQSEILAALASGNSDLNGLWAPNIYTAEEKAGAKQVCSGKDGGVAVPGTLVVRGDYARENPQAVAKFVAVYLRGVKWMGANRNEALAMMKTFYAQGGVNVSDTALRKEFSGQPTFDLDSQVRMFDRGNSNSEADAWFARIAVFMRETGAVNAVPVVQDFVTGEFLNMVKADPKLRDFANGK